MRDRNIAAMYLVPLTAVCLAFAQPATAQDKPETCESAEPLPPALSGWISPDAIIAANDEKGTAETMLVLGRAVEAQLSQTSAVHYAVPPEKSGEPKSYGGMLAFEVPKNGTYQVSLSTTAWVDVIRNGEAITSTTHGHGPECSGIRKIVGFSLEDGLHILQIAANDTPDILVMVTQVP